MTVYIFVCIFDGGSQEVYDDIIVCSIGLMWLLFCSIITLLYYAIIYY